MLGGVRERLHELDRDHAASLRERDAGGGETV